MENHLAKCATAKVSGLRKELDEMKERFGLYHSTTNNGDRSTTNNGDRSTMTTNNSSHVDNSSHVVDNSTRITINNFGCEDRSYINSETNECLHNARVIPLIMDVYFNSAHPENHTIRLKSEKLSRVIVHTDALGAKCADEVLLVSRVSRRLDNRRQDQNDGSREHQ